MQISHGQSESAYLALSVGFEPGAVLLGAVQVSGGRPRASMEVRASQKADDRNWLNLKSAFAYADILVTSHDPPHRSRPLTSLPPGAGSELVRARWDLLGNELRLVDGLVVDRLKTGAGHCNDEFAVPDVKSQYGRNAIPSTILSPVRPDTNSSGPASVHAGCITRKTARLRMGRSGVLGWTPTHSNLASASFRLCHSHDDALLVGSLDY